MLLRKMLRDLKNNAAQFLAIFLMIFLGVFIFSGMTSIGQGMKQSSQDYYDETHLADAIIYSSFFTDQDYERLRSSFGIETVTKRLQMDTTYGSDGATTIQLNVISSDALSGCHLIEGEAFDSDMDGIWLDSEFAKAHQIKTGDMINVTYQNNVFTKTVKGLVMQPEYVYAVQNNNEIVPDHERFGYAFMPEEAWSLGPVPYTQALLKTEDLSKNDLESRVTEVLPGKTTMLVMQEDIPSVAMFRNEIDQMSAVGSVYPVVFLITAILTTLTTMTRITADQRVQIGTLKALGIRNRKITLHYLSFGLLVGGAGSILGVFTGPVFLPPLVFGFQKSMYTMPWWNSAVTPVVYGMAFICFLICCCSCYGASRKQLQGAAAETLRPKAPKTSRHTAMEKSRFWKRLGFYSQWNIRDVLRNKLRSLITVFGIVGCMMLILCGLGMRDTVSNLADTMYGTLQTYETKISLSEKCTDEQLKQLEKEKRHQFLEEAIVEIEKDSGKDMLSLSVFDKGHYFTFQDEKGTALSLPEDGAAITRKTAESEGLSVGDVIKWRSYGSSSWHTERIEEIIQTPLEQGMYMSRNAFEKSGESFEPTSFVTDQEAGKFSGEAYETVQSREDLIGALNSMLEMMNAIIFIMIGAAIVLGLVVLYNLGALSFQEKMRELATLKVLGFQHKRLTKLLRRQTVWLSVVGIAAGIPCGYGLVAYMLLFMGDTLDMQPKIELWSYIFSGIGIFAISLFVVWLVSRKLKRIDMVSALKSVE